MSKTYVIKLGGSALSKSRENLFDFNYLAEFKQSLEPFMTAGDKFFIAVGGGYTMRMYRDLAKNAGIQIVKDLHWIGTTTNVLHAELVRAYFAELADEPTIRYEDYYEPGSFQITRSVMVGGGGRPGHSGDVDAICAADKLGCDTIVSLKNVAAVYDKDPNKFPNAQEQKQLSWDQYLEIIGHKTTHEPGGNYPVDPVASQMARERNYKFVVVAANDLNNLKLVLENKDFRGTTIQN